MGEILVPSSENVRRLIIATAFPGIDLSDTGEQILFGPGGSLDSLGLVNLLADLEYRLDEEFGREIVLASERAMSRNHSPFRDVSSLTAYITEELNR